MNNHKKTSLLFGLLVWAGIASAQVFAYIQYGDDNTGAQALTGYKYAVASRVFEQLLQTHGDFRQQTPQLIMNRRKRYAAWMNPDHVEIGLEEKAYDVCASFGKDSLNALATLLGHELTHYYEKHDWGRHFAMENKDLETARQVERLEEGLKQEAQADYLGGFLALSAGFKPYGIMPELLKKIYQSYSLPDQLPGYPSLLDRLKMVEGAQKRLGELALTFEVSQRLIVAGQYESAADYQRYLLQDFQSRELYNNAAANSLLAALEYVNATEMPYALPIELDPNTRLNGLRGNDAQRLEKQKALLKTAEQQLDMALALDARYAPAMLNKACLHLLRGEWDEAEYWLKKGRKLCADEPCKRPFELLQALHEAMQGDQEKAIQSLTPMAGSGYSLAVTNLAILQKTPAQAPATSDHAFAEQIEQYRLTDFLANPDVNQELKLSENTSCGIHQKKASTIYIHYANNGERYAVWQETAPGYKGATQKGITLQSAAADVKKAYGAPAMEIALPDGVYWVYPAASMYFSLDAGSKVRAWGVYLCSQ